MLTNHGPYDNPIYVHAVSSSNGPLFYEPAIFRIVFIFCTPYPGSISINFFCFSLGSTRSVLSIRPQSQSPCSPCFYLIIIVVVFQLERGKCISCWPRCFGFSGMDRRES